MNVIKYFFVCLICIFIANSAAAKENNDLLHDFFNGPMQAEGSFKSRIDGSERKFRVRMIANWSNHKKTLTLIENFYFQDGERGKKTWVFKQIANGRYEGTREDVIGLADVWQDGDTLKLRYNANLKKSDGNNIEVHFNDELVKISRNKVKNTATVHWWFLTVGDVELNINK
jgi:Protein of unknown function (DUF3833)